MDLKSIGNKAKAMGKAAKNAGKAANKAGNAAKNAYDFADDASQNGADNATMKRLKQKLKKASKKRAKKAAKHAAKLAGQAIKSFFTFIISNPVGWVVGLMLVMFLGGILGSMANNQPDDKQQKTNNYVALLDAGCPTSTGVSNTSLDFGTGTKGSHSLADVAKFASASIKSTWGVDIGKAEALFLTRNQAVATRYGLNKNNIGRVSQAVKNEGVSPVYFWLYACNEDGGAGGFINHFSGSSGDAVTDAKKDAEYLKETASSHSFPPATDDLIKDTSYAKKVLDQMPDGSIGRVYIVATAAVTAEIAYLNGVHAGWTTQYGHPLSDSMDMIKQLGGDPSKGDEISVDTDGGNSCGDSDIQSSGKWGWPFKNVSGDPGKNYEDGQQFGKSAGSSFRTNGFHDGFDFGSAKYHGDVIAVHDGKVKFVGYKYGFWIVWVVSSDGYNEVYQEAFGGKGDIKVKEGQNVKVGDTIGKLTQSHLHLGISKKKLNDPCEHGYNDDGTWLDPIKVIKAGLKGSMSKLSGSDDAARLWIIQHESSGNYNATNGRYYGAYQLDKSYITSKKYGGDGTLSESNQDYVAQKYMEERYHTWKEAKAHWEKNNWW